MKMGQNSQIYTISLFRYALEHSHNNSGPGMGTIPQIYVGVFRNVLEDVVQAGPGVVVKNSKSL